MKEKNNIKKVKTHKKMSSKLKKVLVLSSFCVLPLVTGGVNILVNNLATDDVSAQVSANASFFSNYRDDRQETRNQEILYLDAIIASDATSAEAKKAAEAERLTLIKNMEVALKLENLILAKGFEDVVVSTSTNNISVMVESSGLTTQEVAQIVDIVNRKTGVDISKIVVTPIQ
jgi:stage III sporulation protein AH